MGVPNAGIAPSATRKPSPKVVAGTLAGAISTAFWTVAAATFWKHTFSSEALAALIAPTTTLISAAAAYVKADTVPADS